jgi:hypothetical protein
MFPKVVNLFFNLIGCRNLTLDNLARLPKKELDKRILKQYRILSLVALFPLYLILFS